MGHYTTPLLIPTIYLLQAVTPWRNFFNQAFSGVSIDYTTCSTTSSTDLLCPSFIPPLPPHPHCCGQNTFSTYQTCKGLDSLVYSNVPLCQDTGGETTGKKRPECRTGCSVVTYDGIIEDNLTMLMRDTTSQYCISTMCDTITMKWEINLEICQCQDKTDTDNPVEKLEDYGDDDDNEKDFHNISRVR